MLAARALRHELRASAARRLASLAEPVVAGNVDWLHTEGFWTGLAPEHAPGFDASRQCLGSLAQPDLRVRGAPLRRGLEAYFENGWTLTEVLFSALRGPDAYYKPPAHGLRHAMVFYYGHPAALAVNKLRVAGAIDAGLDEEFDILFETGVDEMSWDDLDTPSTKWPQLSEVRDYRAAARDIVLKTIREHPALDAPLDATAATDSNAVVWALGMIPEHERIHLETSTTLIRELPLEDVRRPDHWPPDHPSVHDAAGVAPKTPTFARVAGGAAALGKPRTHGTFGWDNEYGARTVEARPFACSATQVTNGQFLEFVKDGGYADPALWSDEGWAWRSFRNTKWPHFWETTGPQGLHEYALRLPFSETPLPPDLPAEVNFHEAKAFAAWLGRQRGEALRLPTEAEYQLLRDASDGTSLEDARANEKTDDVASLDSAGMRGANLNLNLAWGSPSAADDGRKPVAGLAGNAWEYCEDWFAALPGFKVHKLYDDFSATCMDGQHSLILGGSFMSTGNEASVFSRFHFRSHFHNLIGFRVVAGEANPELTSHDAAKPWADGWVSPPYVRDAQKEEGSHKYESAQQLAAYLDLHYGGADALLDGPASDLKSLDLRAALDFPTRCADVLDEAVRGTRGLRALDVGCAVGGSAVRLAASPKFDAVVGVDFARGFVEAAEALRAGDLAYSRSGEASQRGSACVAAAVSVEAAAKLSYRRGDACALPEDLGTFDAVLAANLLCRLPEPMAFVDRLRDLVRPDGVVFFASPFSWMEEYTPRDRWLGPDQLEAAMAANGFALERAAPEPVLIRDHARKFQFIVSHGMLFRKSA